MPTPLWAQKVIAIDPGNELSAFCIMDAQSKRPYDFGIMENECLRRYLRRISYDEHTRGAIEMVASYGMAVGREVFDTVRWIGRFEETLTRLLLVPPVLIYRLEEKTHICHDSRAKDANIRRALIDRFAKVDLKNGCGTKKCPDWFYGFKRDIWSAYAVGLTYIETKMKDDI